MLYVGVDAHKSTSQITVMNEAGAILSRKRVNSTCEGFKEALAGYDEPLKAVLEASYSWGPMYDWLDDMSEEVLLAHPLKVRAIASARIKNDRIDSEVLAHLLRANLIPAAHAPSREIRALRRVLRQRMFFVQLRTMLRNRIRALLAQHSVRLPENERLYTKQGRAWLDRVSLPDSELRKQSSTCLGITTTAFGGAGRFLLGCCFRIGSRSFQPRFDDAQTQLMMAPDPTIAS